MPRSRVLTISPNLAISIFVSSSQQHLGFFNRQVSLASGEKPFRMNLEEEREKRGRNQVRVWMWWAGICHREADGLKRRMSREHACHCAGPGSPTMAVPAGWVRREGQAVLNKGALTSARAPAFVYLFSQQNKYQGIFSGPGPPRNGGIEMVFGSQVKKQGGSQVFQEAHSVMDAMVGSGKWLLEQCIHPTEEGKSQGRLPGLRDAWRINRSQTLHVCARAYTHWAWEGRGAGWRQRVPLCDGLGERQDGWGSLYLKGPSPHLPFSS